jgi:hypothetical protein
MFYSRELAKIASNSEYSSTSLSIFTKGRIAISLFILCSPLKRFWYFIKIRLACLTSYWILVSILTNAISIIYCLVYSFSFFLIYVSSWTVKTSSLWSIEKLGLLELDRILDPLPLKGFLRIKALCRLIATDFLSNLLPFFSNWLCYSDMFASRSSEASIFFFLSVGRLCWRFGVKTSH